MKPKSQQSIWFDFVMPNRRLMMDRYGWKCRHTIDSVVQALVAADMIKRLPYKEYIPLVELTRDNVELTVREYEHKHTRWNLFERIFLVSHGEGFYRG